MSSTSGRNSTMGYTNGLLTALTHVQSGVFLTDLAYEYGGDGQLTAIVDNLDPSKSKVISYDALNRLVQVDEGVPTSLGETAIPVEDYAYDSEGNRTASHLSNLYSSNDHNQLLEDDTYSYAYDSKGNRTSRTAKVGGEIETYTYDSQNRLVGYSSPTTTATYAYDAMERRISKTVDGTVTAYVYDMSSDNPLANDDILLEFDATVSPTILTRRWAHSDSVDEPLGFEGYNASGGPGTGTERAIFADRQGSVIWVTVPATGDVVAAYEYDGFGQITQTQGVLSQPYGYTGREYDAESGLYYYRARAYDPSNGVFLQSDPIGFAGGTYNINSFVINNPFNLIDPEGLVFSSTYLRDSTAIQATGISASTRVLEGVAGLAGQISVMLTQQLGHPVPLQEGMMACPASLWNILEKLKPLSDGLQCKGGNGNRIPNVGVMHRLRQAIIMRRMIQSVCFPSGDAGHEQQIQKLYNRMNTCLNLVVFGTKKKPK